MTALTPAPGRFQLVPPLDDEHFAALYDDIKAAGVRVPIDVDEQGNILDGHHRKAIADELGKECPERVVFGLESDAAKEDYAITVNGARRQMSVERRRELATTSLKKHTRLSDREHARRCGVSHTYIANLREVLELAGAIDPAPSRQGRSGGVFRGSGTGDGAATVGDGLATVANPSPKDHRADTPGDEGGSAPPAGEVGSSSQHEVPTSPAQDPGLAGPAEEADARPASSRASSGGPGPATPSAGPGSSTKWTTEEREAHEEEVQVRKDIESAHAFAKNFVTEVRNQCFTILVGYRLGETHLVTAEQIADCRRALDLLEKEVIADAQR